jgi:hypothetical protein
MASSLHRHYVNVFPRIPVLLTTGYGAEASEASDQGFPTLAKPYRPELLHRAIRELLRKTHLNSVAHLPNPAILARDHRN